MVNKECSIYTLCSSRSQQINRSTTHDEEVLGESFTPPESRSTAHSASRASDRSATGSANTRLSTVLQEFACSYERLTLRDEDEAAPSRGRSMSSHTIIDDRYRSFYPSATRKRFGITGLAGVDGMFGGCQSFLKSLDADDKHDMTTETLYCSELTAHHNHSVVEPSDQVVYDASAYAFDGGSPLLREYCDFHTLIKTGTHEGSPRKEGENGGVSNSELFQRTGKWRCCGCQRGHDIYRPGPDEHLISVLSCLCKHRSCRNCTFHGHIKRFAPIDDISGVASIPVTSDGGTTDRFGVVCHTCGLSWRTKTVQKTKTHVITRRRLSILSKKTSPFQRLRHPQSMLYLGLSQSHRSDGARLPAGTSVSHPTMKLRSAVDSQNNGTKPEEQAQGAEVRFHGIECTCGTVTDSTSLCFQLVDFSEAEPEVTANVRAGQFTEAATRCGMPELLTKRHDTPSLHLKGGPHPNPLFSNPVEDARV
ncbi:hypothetical protein SVAN01_10014 [Stagonosporopsis vannaccii]|nr:hypothetical protein SVAN01_10014 [Stagonosporopsis vannaccii]